MKITKTAQVWLNTPGRYEVVRFWIAMLVAAVVIVALLIQSGKLQAQNDTLQAQNETLIGLTQATKDNSDRGIVYLDCIIKIFLTPPSKRSLQGSISDPLAAAEACRTEAGLPNTTPEPVFNPSDAALEQSPPKQTAGSTPSTPPTEPHTQQNPPPPPSIVDMITDIPCHLPLLGRLCN